MHGNKGSRTRKVSQEDEEIIYDWVKNFVFLYNRSIGTLSHNPLFLTLFEFQACDWLWYPLTCGPRGRVGVHMEQKSRSKFLLSSGFEPCQSSTQPLDHCVPGAPLMVIPCHKRMLTTLFPNSFM